MESMIMKITVERSKNNEIVKFLIPNLENISVNITNSDTQDIENLFNLIFQKIIISKQLIKFELHDEKTDLFNEFAKDIVCQLNSEIKNSEDDFRRIIELDGVRKNS